MKTLITYGAAPWTADDLRRLYEHAWTLARRLALREADALAAACRAAGGDDGAALAWAVVDLIADGGAPLTALPLADLADLLASYSDGPAKTLAAVIVAVERLADASLMEPAEAATPSDPASLELAA